MREGSKFGEAVVLAASIGLAAGCGSAEDTGSIAGTGDNCQMSEETAFLEGPESRAGFESEFFLNVENKTEQSNHLKGGKSFIVAGLEKRVGHFSQEDFYFLLHRNQQIAVAEAAKMYYREFGGSLKILEKAFGNLINNPDYRNNLSKTITDACKKYQVPVEVAKGVLGVESRGDSEARSQSKPSARGVFQLLPETFFRVSKMIYLKENNCAGMKSEEIDQVVRKKYQIDNYKDNADVGIKYLSLLFTRFGSWDMALIAYCEGPTKFEDQLCRYFPEIENEITSYEKKGGEHYKKFTSKGYDQYKQMLGSGKINLVGLYSDAKNYPGGKGMGKAHPAGYGYFVAAMADQVESIFKDGKVTAIPEEVLTQIKFLEKTAKNNLGQVSKIEKIKSHNKIDKHRRSLEKKLAKK